MSAPSTAAELVIRNALLAARLSKRVGNRLAAHGISLSEFLVMHYLHQSAARAIPRVELADHMSMSASGVTRLIAPMEKSGIIDKRANPRDARQSLVMLSGAGERLYGEAAVTFEHAAHELLERLGGAGQARMLELIGRVIQP